MHLAKRAALAAAVLVLSAGPTACKKKDAEKKADPTVTPDKGSGSASGTGTGSASGDVKAEAKPAEAALLGFKGAMAVAGGKGPESGGGMGIGAKLGGLFGGGTSAAMADSHKLDKAGPTSIEPGEPVSPDHEGDDVKGGPAPSPAAAIKFPPAGQAGGDCAAVTDRLIIIISAMMNGEMGELTDEQKGAAKTEVDAQMAEMKAMVMTMCTDQAWSQELKDCALAAMSEADLDACEQYAPDDLKHEEPVEDYEPGEDYPAEPPKPVPAWTGGDSCKDVGDRLVQLATAQMGDLPTEAVDEMASSLQEAAEQVKVMCEDGKWSDSVRTCILTAPNIDATGECMAGIAGGDGM